MGWDGQGILSRYEYKDEEYDSAIERIYHAIPYKFIKNKQEFQ